MSSRKKRYLFWLLLTFTTIFEILWVLFEKTSVFYSDWPKSWIWWTLGHVRIIFCKCHLHNPSKEVFWTKIFLNSMHGFKSTILPKLKNCQNEPMQFKKICGQKTSFEVLYRWHLQKISPTCPRVRQILDLGQSE